LSSKHVRIKYLAFLEVFAHWYWELWNITPLIRLHNNWNQLREVTSRSALFVLQLFCGCEKYCRDPKFPEAQGINNQKIGFLPRPESLWKEYADQLFPIDTMYSFIPLRRTTRIVLFLSEFNKLYWWSNNKHFAFNPWSVLRYKKWKPLLALQKSNYGS
jgi:hypothetical protein